VADDVRIFLLKVVVLVWQASEVSTIAERMIYIGSLIINWFVFSIPVGLNG